MPTVEDYFDDDTDIPLPSSSTSRVNLPNTGHHGALLEEITTDDSDDAEIDFSLLADQGRGVFGESSKGAPPPSSSGKGKMTTRVDPGELRPTISAGGGQGQGNANTPMGGFMGDMMRMQQVEDERMEKLRKQFGNASVAADPSVFKAWNTVYPIYFDAKVSINDGRRVPRTSALWWPQASHIALACRVLGLQSVLEPDKCHPADWENPGRVKVQFKKDGRFLNPIVKNRTQLYRHISDQLRQQHPTLVYHKPAPRTKPSQSTTTPSKPLNSKSTKLTKSKTPSRPPRPQLKGPSHPPAPPFPIPKLDDRYPLHSPLIPTGVAVSSVKRDLENEKENKKKGGGAGLLGGGDGEEGGGKGKEKAPKMKKIVIRGKR